MSSYAPRTDFWSVSNHSISRAIIRSPTETCWNIKTDETNLICCQFRQQYRIWWLESVPLFPQQDNHRGRELLLPIDELKGEPATKSKQWLWLYYKQWWASNFDYHSYEPLAKRSLLVVSLPCCCLGLAHKDFWEQHRRLYSRQKPINYG